MIYTVTINDDCYQFEKEFPVHVLVDYYLELPKAFTPNDDKENDIFYAETKNIAGFEFKIFNRWGELIYSSDKSDEGWDGTVDGKIQNTDTYVYHIHAVSEHGYTIEKKGTFLLLK
jgi:gliding motility-associated-like protein